MGELASESVPSHQGNDVLKIHESSPGNEWQFCGKCGTNLIIVTSKAPEKIYVTMANLHGEIDRTPKAHYSYEERVSWLDVRDDLPKYRGKTDETIES